MFRAITLQGKQMINEVQHDLNRIHTVPEPLPRSNRRYAAGANEKHIEDYFGDGGGRKE